VPELLVQLPGQPPRRVPLGREPVRIGRAAECELVIAEAGISRHHATVRRAGAGFVVEDAGSRNGSFVNGNRIERQPLAPGDRIRVGEVEIEFVADEAEEAATEAPAGRGLAGLGGFLRETAWLLHPLEPLGGAGPVRLDARVTTVGREASARLVLEDESISRMHARLDREGGDLVVTDLKSRNGVMLNGEKVLRAALQDGDQVQFGNLGFEVERRETLAAGRIGLAAGGLVLLVALVFGVRAVNDYLAERSAVAEAERRVHAQALASIEKGIAAFRRGDADYARGYLLYAADVLLLSNLAPPGSSIARPEEVFRRITRELPPADRNFDFARALDPAAVNAARERLEGLTNQEYVERQTHRLAIELGQDEKVPAGFVAQVWQVVDQSSGAGHASFQTILDRSPRIHPRLRELMAEAHLPEVFCYVAWVESALDPRATSQVGARGLWQFMESTGRLYGLRIDRQRSLDERTEVVPSTRAATRYIGNLIRKFGREQFMCALASYNRGEGGVWRAMEKIPDPMMESSRKYWYLVENGLLPRETKDYVPKIFATQILAEDPDRFGFRRP
jgi:pSer/pThr/pTyr-binding forkhead associated (FHA) protein